MKTARVRIAKGEYAEALSSLKDLAAEDKRPDVAADIEFYKAFCAARLALGGSGAIVDAGREMAAFAKKYPDSYHYLEACQIVADLLVADGRFDKAESYYGELAKAPWEDTKMRAAIGTGRALLAQGKAAEALKVFDDVLGHELEGPRGEVQRLTAKLGKARCLAATKKTDEAIQIAQRLSPRPMPTTRTCSPKPTTPWAVPCEVRAVPRRRCWPMCMSMCSITARRKCTPRPWRIWSSYSASCTSPIMRPAACRSSSSAIRTARGARGSAGAAVNHIVTSPIFSAASRRRGN